MLMRVIRGRVSLQVPQPVIFGGYWPKVSDKYLANLALLTGISMQGCKTRGRMGHKKVF